MSGGDSLAIDPRHCLALNLRRSAERAVLLPPDMAYIALSEKTVEVGGLISHRSFDQILLIDDPADGRVARLVALLTFAGLTGFHHCREHCGPPTSQLGLIRVSADTLRALADELMRRAGASTCGDGRPEDCQTGAKRNAR